MRISQKNLLVSAVVLMFFFCGDISAQTCYDPAYGYYDCSENYYYPDQGEAFMEGAFLGMILGGFMGGDFDRDHHRGGGEEHHEGGGHWDEHHH